MTIRINVHPTDPSLPSFVTEGEIVRVLEDGRGFSFRFNRLTDDARKAIQTYIENEKTNA